jgi:hypothetical protein
MHASHVPRTSPHVPARPPARPRTSPHVPRVRAVPETRQGELHACSRPPHPGGPLRRFTSIRTGPAGSNDRPAIPDRRPGPVGAYAPARASSGAPRGCASGCLRRRWLRGACVVAWRVRKCKLRCLRGACASGGGVPHASRAVLWGPGDGAGPQWAADWRGPQRCGPCFRASTYPCYSSALSRFRIPDAASAMQTPAPTGLGRAAMGFSTRAGPAAAGAGARPAAAASAAAAADRPQPQPQNPARPPHVRRARREG